MTKKQDITAIIKDKRGRVLSAGKNSYTNAHMNQGPTGVNLMVFNYTHSQITLDCEI